MNEFHGSRSVPLRDIQIADSPYAPEFTIATNANN